jgi:acyl-CoA reductase-like NAD-dependent aldehyde dehydrogenase
MEYKNFINGEWTGAKSKEKFENRNPATWEELIGVFPRSGPQDVDEAVAAAEEAFKKWRLVPAPKRAEIIFRAGELLRKNKEEISRDMTREMGKVLQETRGDTQEGIDTAYYAAGEGRRLFGDTSPAELPNKFAMSIRQPIGVCGIISPWNFPMAIPTWKIFPALVCGNTVVFKPASDTPLTAVKLVEILMEAGLPSGVINLVHGTGSGVGTPLIEHPRVKLISFTGSSSVGKQIAAFCGKTLKRVSLELGGKNAQIVMDDANLELAVEGALWGAFGTTGQRCTATSRIILHEKIKDKFLSMFLERVRRLRLGNGLDSAVDVGPLVNKAQREQIHSYVEIGKKEGAKLVAGGRPYEEGECKKGWFYEPTVFDEVLPKMRIAQEEIFGPVVSVLKAHSLSEAVELLNDSSYGLSSSIYTNNVSSALTAIRDIEAGITYVNGPTIGAEVHLPFGGVKDTGNGHRESGTAVLDVFTEWKSVYIDYSGKLQKAQIDAVAIE